MTVEPNQLPEYAAPLPANEVDARHNADGGADAR
jgi:hypothetical protein